MKKGKYAARNTAAHGRGLRTRRKVLGSLHVARAMAARTEFDADFQAFVTEVAWGAVWSRPGLDLRTRHLVTIGILACLGREHELALHIQNIGRTGVTVADLREVFLHVAAYAGIPAANSAVALAKQLLARPPKP